MTAGVYAVEHKDVPGPRLAAGGLSLRHLESEEPCTPTKRPRDAARSEPASTAVAQKKREPVDDEEEMEDVDEKEDAS